MPFCTCESRILPNFVPLPSVGIEGVVGLENRK